jgi:hypothetical protein
MPAPLDPELRRKIAEHIHLGHGRNEIARKLGVSTGVVTKIARENYLGFSNVQTVKATQAQQIDQWAARVDKSGEVWAEYMAAGNKPNGEPTRRLRRAEYAMYNLDRHHNGLYATFKVA